MTSITWGSNVIYNKCFYLSQLCMESRKGYLLIFLIDECADDFFSELFCLKCQKTVKNAVYLPLFPKAQHDVFNLLVNQNLKLFSLLLYIKRKYMI